MSRIRMYKVCCNTITRKCTGNTDSSKYICSNLSGKCGLIEIMKINNDKDIQEECCEITGYCSGNTVNRGLEIPYNEDIMKWTKTYINVKLLKSPNRKL